MAKTKAKANMQVFLLAIWINTIFKAIKYCSPKYLKPKSFIIKNSKKLN